MHCRYEVGKETLLTGPTRDNECCTHETRGEWNEWEKKREKCSSPLTGKSKLQFSITLPQFSPHRKIKPQFSLTGK